MPFSHSNKDDKTTDAYERVQVQGRTLNKRTAAALEAAQALTPRDPDWTLAQGSYNAGGVAVSGGTHDGGGAIDTTAYNWGHRVRALRDVGFAAWHRPELWSGSTRVWGEHIHAILIGDKEMSDAARDQVEQYRAGTNGLADHGPDNFRHHPDGVVFDYPAYLAEKRREENRRLRAKAAVDAAVDKLRFAREQTDDPKDRALITDVIGNLLNL